MFSGIDVSKWQGIINWEKVKAAGEKFAILRASYGVTGIDPMFFRNVKETNRLGIDTGAYHYSYAKTTAQAVLEAHHFLNTIKGHSFTYPLVLDLEDESQASLDKQTLTNIAVAFLNEIRMAGYYPMLYASKYWLENKLMMHDLRQYDVWLAQYREGSFTYRGRVDIWQYKSTGRLSGIEGNVDMDKSYRDYPEIIRKAGLNHLEEKKEMTLEEAKKIIQEKTGFDNNTMQYLEFYRYANSMIIRMAEAMEKA